MNTTKVVSVQCEGLKETVALEKLKPFQGNLKKISAPSLEKLKTNLVKNGICAPLGVWSHKKEEKLIDGHHRFMALQSLKSDGYFIPLIPVHRVVAKTEAEARRKILALSSQYTEMNKTELMKFAEAAEMTLDDMNEELLFADVNFDNLAFKENEPEVDEAADEIPPVPVTTSVKVGDVFQLGEHRVMCGDSTNPHHVKALMDGKKAFMIVTDPPYGVKYDPEWRNETRNNKKSERVGKVQNDDRADWSEVWKIFEPDVIYTWHGAKHTSEVVKSLLGSGYDLRGQIIWAKQNFALSRGDYHWQHEPCWYAVKKGAKSKWVGDRSQSTIWNIKQTKNEDDAKTIHGTQKPVECMLRPMRNHGTATDLIVDPFLGSGSSIIAGELAKKTVYGMELDPLYVHVILERYAVRTGKKAKKV